MSFGLRSGKEKKNLFVAVQGCAERKFVTGVISDALNKAAS